MISDSHGAFPVIIVFCIAPFSGLDTFTWLYFAAHPSIFYSCERIVHNMWILSGSNKPYTKRDMYADTYPVWT